MGEALYIPQPLMNIPAIIGTLSQCISRTGARCNRVRDEEIARFIMLCSPVIVQARAAPGGPGGNVTWAERCR
ncbi:hypothetical protein SODG_002491 [Sodalis praecaptivus]